MVTLPDDTDLDLLPNAPEERRRAFRRKMAIPTRVDTKVRPQRFAMTQDISRTGALLATPSRFRIGEHAVLRFRSPDATTGYTRVDARIVRLEINRHDRVGVWPYLAAVRFAVPLESAAAGADEEPTTG